MKPYNPHKDNPEHSAYFNGLTYQCINLDCWIRGVRVRECGRIYHIKAYEYTPILRCPECGTVYFGNPTIDHEDINERHKEAREHTERVKADISELAQKDAEEADIELTTEQTKQDEVLKAEVEAHEAEISGDIILPNMLTFRN